MSYRGNLDTRRGLIGKLGEDFACQYLESIGHLILERNYQIRYGEIDIVSQSKKNNKLVLHIIEVKTTSSPVTTPQEHLDYRKMNKLKNLADIYFNQYLTKLEKQKKSIDYLTLSLDFIGVTLNAKKSLKKIDYLEGLEI